MYKVRPCRLCIWTCKLCIFMHMNAKSMAVLQGSLSGRTCTPVWVAFASSQRLELELPALSALPALLAMLWWPWVSKLTPASSSFCTTPRLLWSSQEQGGLQIQCLSRLCWHRGRSQTSGCNALDSKFWSHYDTVASAYVLQFALTL